MCDRKHRNATIASASNRPANNPTLTNHHAQGMHKLNFMGTLLYRPPSFCRQDQLFNGCKTAVAKFYHETGKGRHVETGTLLRPRRKKPYSEGTTFFDFTDLRNGALEHEYASGYTMLLPTTSLLDLENSLIAFKNSIMLRLS